MAYFPYPITLHKNFSYLKSWHLSSRYNRIIRENLENLPGLINVANAKCSILKAVYYKQVEDSQDSRQESTILLALNLIHDRMNMLGWIIYRIRYEHTTPGRQPFSCFLISNNMKLSDCRNVDLITTLTPLFMRQKSFDGPPGRTVLSLRSWAIFCVDFQVEMWDSSCLRFDSCLGAMQH